MSTRRRDDPEGLDFSETRETRVASSLPSWARMVSAIGAPTLIAFYLLGMIPGMASPFKEIRDDMRAAAAALERHDQATREQLRIQKLVCAGIWKTEPHMSRACFNGANGHEGR